MANSFAFSMAPVDVSQDGETLRRSLHRAQMKAKIKALLLVSPLLLFIVVTFLVPIGQLMIRSVYHDGFSSNAPNLAAWFEINPEGTAPTEEAYAALVADLQLMNQTKTAGGAGTRINYSVPGARSLFTSTARAAKNLQPPFKEAVLAHDARWEDPLLWTAMRNAASPWTLDFYLTGMDMRYGKDGGVELLPSGERIYLWLYAKTFILSGIITLICLLLAFPIAHLLATLPPKTSNLLMILVLLPFWTSLLVRTTSWIVLLQGQGVVNSLLVATGLIDDSGRLSMIYNQTGTIIVMVHILLPFMVLPLYSIMKVIPASYVRAARSLGATPWTAFWRVYLPQTLPGIAAGVLLVFILAVGYYITPALVGGADGQLFSNQIQFHMSRSNWSQAAALAAMLLTGVLVLYWLYDRLIGIDKLKLG